MIYINILKYYQLLLFLSATTTFLLVVKLAVWIVPLEGDSEHSLAQKIAWFCKSLSPKKSQNGWS